MEEKVNEILRLLEGNDEQTKKEILFECATKIGSKEWADAAIDLWNRMENLNNEE